MMENLIMFQTKRFGLVAISKSTRCYVELNDTVNKKKSWQVNACQLLKYIKRVCNVMEINMIDVQLMQAFHDHDIETIKRLQSTKLNLDNN